MNISFYVLALIKNIRACSCFMWACVHCGVVNHIQTLLNDKKQDIFWAQWPFLLHFFFFSPESNLKLFSRSRCYNSNWAYIQWVGFCDVLLRPLLGHFNYSRAGCNWSRLRGILLSMKMSLGVNTAKQTLPPLCSTRVHRTGGGRGRCVVSLTSP